MTIAHINGRPATAEQLAPLAFAGFAHFTAMQIRDHRVRGLDLHLDRLRAASAELFGRAEPDELIREYIRAVLAEAPADASLTVTVSTGEFVPDAPLRVLVRAGDPSDGPAGPLALDVVHHERWMPRLKHVGEGAKTHLLRTAKARGFDDAAFADGDGRLSEATIWNLAFWDGTSVLWPRAEILTGTTMGILRRRLTVPQTTVDLRPGDLTGLAGVVMNSWTPAVPLSRVGDVELADAGEFAGVLREAFGREEWTRV
ncbi:hypothetical protein Afil01_50770 [Actinorhabdospora filicis]|uniref:Branched-subunit amino acid aminotransferase/4-amino-4-deoxychorismate lyase n=1 Tax=Actinorhabdospora filicis TaxID=1785913 RepID=A0A9W6WCX9_9ACTN|nr:aminotransferase class IV [Actinorhabdospora filicis]GLZ80270.1 hypothetical protein Afil01_50770 [Actinorhabdospora filicis]